VDILQLIATRLCLYTALLSEYQIRISINSRSSKSPRHASPAFNQSIPDGRCTKCCVSSFREIFTSTKYRTGFTTKFPHILFNHHNHTNPYHKSLAQTQPSSFFFFQMMQFFHETEKMLCRRTWNSTGCSKSPQ
jgi:hypothetical protein